MSASASNFDKPVGFKKGQVIFAEGEASSYLYIVVSGEVRVFKENSGKLMPITIVGPKDFIGELSMFNDEPRSATAIATKDNTQLMIIKKSDIRKVLRACPEWVTNIMVTISDRLRSTVEVLREHRIVDDINTTNDQLGPEELKGLKENVEAYRSRRGL